MTSNKIEGYFIQQNWRLFFILSPQVFQNLYPFKGWPHSSIRHSQAGWWWSPDSAKAGGARWSSVVTPLTCCAMQWSFPESRENPKLFEGWNLGTGHPFDNYIINGIATTKLWWLQSWFLIYYFHLGNYYDYTLYTSPIFAFAICSWIIFIHHLCPAWHHGMGCIGNGPRFAKYAIVCLCWPYMTQW